MKYYFAGAYFSLINILDMSNDPKCEKYILAETHETGYVFQIICITGYSSGRIFGYINEEERAINDKVAGATKEHLLQEIKRNMMFDESSFELFEKPPLLAHD